MYFTSCTFRMISSQSHLRKQCHLHALSPDLVWVRLPSITVVWEGRGAGGSWPGPEACSDGEIFWRLGGNHKGGCGGVIWSGNETTPKTKHVSYSCVRSGNKTHSCSFCFPLTAWILHTHTHTHTKMVAQWLWCEPHAAQALICPSLQPGPWALCPGSVAGGSVALFHSCYILQDVDTLKLWSCLFSLLLHALQVRRRGN